MVFQEFQNCSGTTSNDEWKEKRKTECSCCAIECTFALVQSVWSAAASLILNTLHSACNTISRSNEFKRKKNTTTCPTSGIRIKGEWFGSGGSVHSVLLNILQIHFWPLISLQLPLQLLPEELLPDQLLLSLASNLTQLTQLAPSTYLAPQLPFDLQRFKRQSTDYLYQVIFHRCSNWRIQKGSICLGGGFQILGVKSKGSLECFWRESPKTQLSTIP